MKNVFLGFLLVCIVCSPLFAQSKDDQYQSGTIVSIDNHPVSDRGGTDAALASNVADHDISIQVGDTVYVCRYHTPSDKDLSWLRNRDVQAKIQGKVMYIKVNGKEKKARIVSSSKAQG